MAFVLRGYVYIVSFSFFGCHKSGQDGPGQIVVLLVVILLVASSLCRHLLKYPVSLL